MTNDAKREELARAKEELKKAERSYKACRLEESKQKAKARLDAAKAALARLLGEEEEPEEIPKAGSVSLEELVEEPVAERENTPQPAEQATPAPVAEPVPEADLSDPFVLQAAIMQNMKAVQPSYNAAESAAIVNTNLQMGFNGVFKGQQFIAEQVTASEQNNVSRHKELSKKIDSIEGVGFSITGAIVAIIVFVLIFAACMFFALPETFIMRPLISILIGFIGGVCTLVCWPKEKTE